MNEWRSNGKQALPLWIRWLAWSVPADRRDDILGDLEEGWSSDAAGSLTRLEAARWLLGTALRLRWLGVMRHLLSTREQLAAAPAELLGSLRQFRSSPLYSSAVIVTVGLGTTVAVVAGSLATGTLRPSLPYLEADRLVAVFATERDGAEFRNPTSPADFADWRKVASLGDLTAARPWSPSLMVDGRSTKIQGLLATPDLFALLGASAAAGRPFDRGVLETAESPVVVASTLASRLDLGREDIGETLLLDGEPRVLAAIMAPDFLFPPFWLEEAEIWAPLDLRGESSSEATRGSRFLRVFGRLEPGATIEAAQAELDAWAAVAQREHPASNTGVGARVERLSTPSVERARLPLLALLGASIALMLLIEFNLALLLVARTAMRGRELAVRAALGASAARIRLILLCETGLLVAAGTTLGVAAAPLVLGWLGPMATDLLPRFSSLRVDGGVVLVLIGAQAVCAVLVSRRGASPGPDGARLRSRGLASSLGSRRAFVVAEVAITAWLLLTATMLLSSFERLTREDLGFEAAGAVSTRIDISRAVPDGRRVVVLADLEERLAADPAVQSAGLVNHLPIRGDLWRTRVFAVGVTPEDADIRAAYRLGSTGGFGALGLRLVAGRWIDESDDDRSAPSVVINTRAAEVLWPGVDPASLIDRQVALGSLRDDGARCRVVGVVANVKQSGVGDRVIPEIHLPLAQAPSRLLGDLTLVARGPEIGALQSAIRRAVQPLGPDVALFDAEPLETTVADDLVNERVQAGVAAGFALFALLVAGFGVFALIGTVGSVRRQEFAIRRVVGSTRGSVIRLVLREGAWLGVLGAVLGLLVGAGLARAVEPLLFDLDPFAPRLYAAVALVTILLAVGVSVPSAWRAARTPIVRGIER